MANILKYIPILRQLEGGYSDNPNDKGGPTMCGVTLSTFQHFFGANMTVSDLQAMTDEQFAEVVKEYWDSAQGDNINDQQVAQALIDWIYNSGQDTPIKAVQGILIGPITGFLGTITLANINKADPATLCNAICDARVKFYNDLAEETPSDEEFLDGWLRRANLFRYQIT